MEISCSTVKDLLPTYCEGLCSEYTKFVLDEHVTKCENCNKLQKAIKRLIKQRNIFIGLSSILIILITLTAIISCKLFIFGATAPTAIIKTVQFEMKDEKTFAYQFRLMSTNQVVNRTLMTAPDKFGHVYIQVNAGLPSPLNSPYAESKGSTRYDKEIRAVYLQGKAKKDVIVLWEKK